VRRERESVERVHESVGSNVYTFCSDECRANSWSIRAGTSLDANRAPVGLAASKTLESAAW